MEDCKELLRLTVRELRKGREEMKEWKEEMSQGRDRRRKEEEEDNFYQKRGG